MPSLLCYALACEETVAAIVRVFSIVNSDGLIDSEAPL